MKQRRWRLFVALILGAFMTAAMIGLVKNVTAESMLLDTRINTDTGTARQTEPAIAMNYYGYSVICWRDFRDDGSHAKIYAQLVSAKGHAFLNNFPVDTIDINVSQENQAIAINDRGNFVVVWDDNRDPEANCVYAKMFAANGIARTAAFRVNEILTGAYEPAIGMNRHGNFVICWRQYYGFHNDMIYAQRFDSTGSPIGANFLVNDDFTGTRGHPVAAMLEDGSFVLVWNDDRSGVGDMYAQRYDTDGNAVGANFEVSTHPEQHTGTQYLDFALHENGDFLICWAYAAAGGMKHNVYGKLYNKSGEVIKDIFNVNDADVGDNYRPMVRANPTGGYLVVWESDKEGDFNIHARVIDASGNRGAGARVNDLPGKQWFSCLAIDGRGIALFAWGDDRNGNEDIYGTWSGTINLLQLRPLNLYAGSDFDNIVPLRWDPIYGDFPKAEVYHIYRSNISGGPYTQVATVTEHGTPGNRMRDWIDTDVENGHYYYYVVTAEASGLESPYSNKATANPHAGVLGLQSAWATTIPVIDGHSNVQWNDAAMYFIDDRGVLGYVNMCIKNNADYLYLGFYDSNNDIIDPLDMVNIFFDLNNDGAWDAASPSSEGFITIAPTSAAFTGLWGSYPDDLGSDTIVPSPTGIENAVARDYHGLFYEIAINLHTSVIHAIPGQTIGFGICLNDPGNFYPGTYGFSAEWPWGLLPGAVATLGHLTLAQTTNMGEHAADSTHPETFILHQSFPNPFNPETTIRYELPTTSNVHLAVYNIKGQLVKTLVDETETAGVRTVTWNGRSNDGSALPSGMYVCRMIASGNVFQCKMMLMK